MAEGQKKPKREKLALKPKGVGFVRPSDKAAAYRLIDIAAASHTSDPFWADRMKSRYDNKQLTGKEIAEGTFQ